MLRLAHPAPLVAPVVPISKQGRFLVAIGHNLYRTCVVTDLLSPQ